MPPDFRRPVRPSRPEPAPKLPPHDEPSEIGVLGCCILSPNESLPLVIEHYKEGVWFDLRHATIWEVLQEMFDQREEIDLITVQRALKDKNSLEAIGGLAYLSSLQDAVPSAANLSSYLSILREKHQLRQMIQTCSAVVQKVYECEKEANAMMDEAERDVLAIRHQRTAKGQMTIKELIQHNIETIDRISRAEGKPMGLCTGFYALDRKMNGMEPGDLIIIGARPSVGKTALGLNICNNVSVNCRLPGGVFSLEMTAEALTLRLLSSRSAINLRDIRDQIVTDYSPMVQAGLDISNSPLHIDATPSITITQLRAKARRMAQQHNIQYLVVDYLQRIKGSGKYKDRRQDITEVSNGLKELALELNIPVIALAQLNRDLAKEKGRDPRVDDLKESGDIEADADKILLLSKKNNDVDDGDEEKISVLVNLAKHRNGATGRVWLDFWKRITRFQEPPVVEDNEFGK